MPGRKKPVQREKFEQANAVHVFETFGGKVYVIGTRRPAGKPCPKCGTFVKEHQGTCQTEGIADVLIFMPTRRRLRPHGTLDVVQDVYPIGTPERRIVFMECKARDARGRMNTMSAEQREFREMCLAACTDHVVGGLDEAIAWLCTNGYARTDQFPHYRVQHITASSQTV